MTSSNWNILRDTGHLCGESTGHWWICRTKVTRSFDDLFDFRPWKQWWSLWFEAPSRPLWRYCNVMIAAASSRAHVEYIGVVQLRLTFDNDNVDVAAADGAQRTAFDVTRSLSLWHYGKCWSSLILDELFIWDWHFQWQMAFVTVINIRSKLTHRNHTDQMVSIDCAQCVRFSQLPVTLSGRSLRGSLLHMDSYYFIQLLPESIRINEA